ncbi:5-oxoprolinase subunit PxpA [Pararhizobium sp. IMCC21322]|uniref:5-oxoprolinase subunit PxpA n=1 Tax=Pararhizobium sp. IMCC21322 TaxID=3067903 RepID=UPI0027427DCF|nr:5-oxoprolinase subunit PxpA [Pararhizobium sp. IMCC21322]
MLTMNASTKRLCLDADMGESFGVYRHGNDAELIPLITSANIACGMHAGDPSVMARTVELAIAHGTCIGAHPGFNDIWGFGRREMNMPTKDIEYLVTYQIGALQAIAGAKGATVDYVKPHGALNNMAHYDPEIASAIARGIRAADRNLIFVANCLSEMVTSGQDQGLRVIHEAYCDRQYLPNGCLMPRAMKNAVISDPGIAVERTLLMLERQELEAFDGTKLTTPIETFCIHGDESSALPIAKAIRKSCEKNNIPTATIADMARP